MYIFLIIIHINRTYITKKKKSHRKSAIKGSFLFNLSKNRLLIENLRVVGKGQNGVIIPADLKPFFVITRVRHHINAFFAPIALALLLKIPFFENLLHYVPIEIDDNRLIAACEKFEDRGADRHRHKEIGENEPLSDTVRAGL